MINSERFKLLYGRYAVPKCRLGEQLSSRPHAAAGGGRCSPRRNGRAAARALCRESRPPPRVAIATPYPLERRFAFWGKRGKKNGLHAF